MINLGQDENIAVLLWSAVWGEAMKIKLNVPYSLVNEKCKVDMYLPDAERFPVIVHIHGGGLVDGHRAEPHFQDQAKFFAERGYAFVSVGYRLYTDGARFPDYLNDVAEAVAFVKEQLKNEAEKIVIAGQSAGAWMALLLCLNPEYLRRVNIEPTEIDGWVIESAQTTSHFNVLKQERGCDPRLQRVDEFAPLYYVSDKTSFSRMLLFFYDRDMACREEQNMLFIKSIFYFNPQANLKYQKLVGTHCFGSIKKDEKGEYAFARETLKWLKEEGI
jgi:pimeloyl-ACP methyl ester carboxylesterase